MVVPRRESFLGARPPELLGPFEPGGRIQEEAKDREFERGLHQRSDIAVAQAAADLPANRVAGLHLHDQIIADESFRAS
jgi:hypothetical protein